MRLGWLLPALLLAASAAAEEESLTLTVSDTPPVDRIVIDPMAPRDEKGVRFQGTATLYLEDGSRIALSAKRKRKIRTGNWKFSLRTLEGAKPRGRVRFQTSPDFGEVLRFRLHLRLGKVKQRDAAKASASPGPPKPLVPEDILALHDRDLAASPPSCQATGCHPNQLTRYAPFKGPAGEDVETFHYLKARILAAFFEGPSPDRLTDKDCTVCHKRVKLLGHSGGDAAGAGLHLRRLVDTSFCAGCHGPGGPGKPLYLK